MRGFCLLVIMGMISLSAGSVFARHSTYHRHYGYHHMYSTPAIYGKTELTNTLNHVISSSNNRANISVYVKSMKFGDALYSRNVTQPLTPASTIKVLTAEAGLIYLGGDYRFSTQLLTDAKSIKNGMLQGNVYVVLSGDPSLTYEDLITLLASLRLQQIQTISGNVYIDNSAYDQRFYGPGWEGKDRSYCYAAPISAGIINHNCLSFQTAQALASSKVANNNRSRACYIRFSRSQNSVIAINRCMAKGRYIGAGSVVTDVPEYNRSLIKNVLSQLGVQVYGRITFESAKNNLSMLSSHASKPLRELITDMLKKSDNVIAGALFKKIGQLYSRKPGSWENGSIAVSKILQEYAGVNINGLRILDGSGISASNLTTSTQLMQVLDYAYHHSISTDFIQALPIAGVDGTLKHRMGNIARKVRAKTGTLSGAVSLAGYVTSADKEPLAFVIIVNSPKGLSWRYRPIEDKIATVLTKYKRTI